MPDRTEDTNRKAAAALGRHLSRLCACLILVAGAATAQTGAEAPGAAGADRLPPEPQVFSRDFTGTFGGQKVDYSSTAGETFIRDPRGEPVASVFSVAYTKRRAASDRPVVFIFNGGPGTSSLFLHIGLLGPKRAPLPQDLVAAGNPPFPVEDNTRTLLDIADLVFIDPIGTGYSRVIGDGKREDYWGIEEDGRVLTEFMRLWLTEHGRWNAPKYLLGESYGTTRAVQIVKEFQSAFTGHMPSGVILISAALDFRSLVFESGNPLPYVSFLPTYSATALFHDKVRPRPQDPQAFLQEARDFAVEEYAVALLKGNLLTAAERSRIADRLAYFTGLSKEYVERADLRVDSRRFRKELLRDRGRIVGHLDGRYLGEDGDDAGEAPGSDPSSTAMENAYLATYLDHLTRVLGVDIDRPYRGYNREVSRNWKWTQPNLIPSGVNLGPILAEAMRANPRFRVLLGSGIYDFSTPVFASELVFAQNGIEPGQVVQKRYEAGHMPYTHAPALEAGLQDIRDFILDDLGRSP